MAKHASDIVQVKVRMRADAHRRLEKEADRHGQTLNAEILTRLDRSFERRGTQIRGAGTARSRPRLSRKA